MMNRIVGRDDEVGALLRFLDGATSKPGALELVGDAGIGKSVLWEAGVALAIDRSYRVLSCRPVESEARFSYAVLTELLAHDFDDAAD